MFPCLFHLVIYIWKTKEITWPSSSRHVALFPFFNIYSWNVRKRNETNNTKRALALIRIPHSNAYQIANSGCRCCCCNKTIHMIMVWCTLKWHVHSIGFSVAIYKTFYLPEHNLSCADVQHPQTEWLRNFMCQCVQYTHHNKNIKSSLMQLFLSFFFFFYLKKP